MTRYETELWNKIKHFEFDEPATEFTFARRLAKENALAPEFAQRVIDEYRKFIFLCCVAKGQIAPSHLVDLAWHLHLTYTRSYWIDLCKNTLESDLHHNPTRGGDAEERKYKGLYRDTLAMYKQYFGAEPPRDIWPDRNQPLRDNLVEVDKRRNWIIRKPDLSFQRSHASVTLPILILAVVTLGCAAESVAFVLGAAVLVGIIFFVVRRNNRRGGSDSSGCSATSGCGSDSSDTGSDSGDDGGSDGGGDGGGCGGGCGGGGD